MDSSGLIQNKWMDGWTTKFLKLSQIKRSLAQPRSCNWVFFRGLLFGATCIQYVTIKPCIFPLVADTLHIGLFFFVDNQL